MIKPDSIKIIGTEHIQKYVVEYHDDGPREIIVNSAVVKIITAAIQLGREQVQSEVKKALDILR